MNSQIVGTIEEEVVSSLHSLDTKPTSIIHGAFVRQQPNETLELGTNLNVPNDSKESRSIPLKLSHLYKDLAEKIP